MWFGDGYTATLSPPAIRTGVGPVDMTILRPCLVSKFSFKFLTFSSDQNFPKYINFQLFRHTVSISSNFQIYRETKQSLNRLEKSRVELLERKVRLNAVCVENERVINAVNIKKERKA